MDAPPAQILDLGPARLRLRPASPLAWVDLARQVPGPACLALALSERRVVGWEGLRGLDGAAAAFEPGQMAWLPAALLDRLLAGLCPPWLDDSLAAELNALESFLRARVDYPALDCAHCQEQEARGEGAPDCAACPLPPAPPGAESALTLHALLRHLPGGGGVWLPILTAGLDLEESRRLGLRLALIQRVLEPRAAPPDLPAPAWRW